MKNFHKMRKKREFLFDDKELYALGFLTVTILLLVFTLGFMLGQTLQEQSVASPLADSNYIAGDELESTEDGMSQGDMSLAESSEDASTTVQKNDKGFQQSHFRILPDTDTYVEVEVTPAGKVISQPGAAKELEQAKQKEETSQKETSKEATKEETPVPPVVASVAPSSPQNAAMVPSLPNVPRNPSDEFRFGRQSSAPGEITTPLTGMVYSVQVASSPSKRDAERLQQKYGQLGYLAYIMTADLGEKGIWYRVRVGNLQTRTEAEILKEELLEKAPRLTNKPFVIKVTGE